MLIYTLYLEIVKSFKLFFDPYNKKINKLRIINNKEFI